MGVTRINEVSYPIAGGVARIFQWYLIFMNKKSGPSVQYIQENRENIGQQIRTFREKKGYSQDELAEIMEVNRSTISKIETGKFAITIDYLVRFAWHLDFDVSILEKRNR